MHIFASLSYSFNFLGKASTVYKMSMQWKSKYIYSEKYFFHFKNPTQ